MGNLSRPPVQQATKAQGCNFALDDVGNRVRSVSIACRACVRQAAADWPGEAFGGMEPGRYGGVAAGVKQASAKNCAYDFGFPEADSRDRRIRVESGRSEGANFS